MKETPLLRKGLINLWRAAVALGLWLGVSTEGAGSVVINEILYAPADKTKPTEFVELLNSGAQSVDLSGWQLANTVVYIFPSNTILPPQGFAVIASTPAAFQAAYGFAPLGPWTGRLKRGGATIELRDQNGTLVDEVGYRPGFPWPANAHGEGSSIELIHPSLDNSLAGSWRSSGATGYAAQATTYIQAQDPQWRFRKGTSEASSPTTAWRRLDFAEDESWQTAQTSIGFGDNDDKTDLSQEPWSLPTPMQTNYISLYLRHAFTVPVGVLPTRLHLKVSVEDGCIIWVNGHEVVPRLHMKDTAEKPFDAGVPGQPPGATTHKAVSGGKTVVEDVFINSQAAGLVAGSNMIAIHVFNSSLAGAGVSIDCQVIGEVADATPGAVNGAFAANAPPQMRQVNHTPVQPVSGVAESITVKVTDPDGVAGVTLAYQTVDPGAYIRKSDPAYKTRWIEVAMRDDGQGGDLVAQDGIFSATLPAEVQRHRRLVRYRITATDTGGRSVQVP